MQHSIKKLCRVRFAGFAFFYFRLYPSHSEEPQGPSDSPLPRRTLGMTKLVDVAGTPLTKMI